MYQQYESQIAEFIEVGKSLFERGYATGAAGNMSLILDENLIVATPTGSSLGKLQKDHLSFIDRSGNLLSGDKPTKEVSFHLAIYENNPSLKAVVHLHSCYSTALSCLNNLNEQSVIKPFTPYVVMRMGDIPLVPYYAPGSPNIARDLSKLAPNHNAFLLANHGPVTCGKNLIEAVNNAEELEATARIYFLLSGIQEQVRYLSDEEIAELRK